MSKSKVVLMSHSSSEIFDLGLKTQSKLIEFVDLHERFFCGINR